MGEMLGLPVRRSRINAFLTVARVRIRHSGRAVGRLAILRARLAVAVTRNLNMFTLIALGTGVAFVYSIVATLAPSIFPASFQDVHGEVAVYFEAAAVIITLVLLGQVMELRARHRTGAAIRALLGLAPKTARRIEPDGSERDVALEDDSGRRSSASAAGRKVAGRRFCFRGQSAVDESMITR